MWQQKITGWHFEPRWPTTQNYRRKNEGWTAEGRKRQWNGVKTCPKARDSTKAGSVSIVRGFDNPTVSRVNFKVQPLKLRLAITLTLTDTGGTVLTLQIIELSDYQAATLKPATSELCQKWLNIVNRLRHAKTFELSQSRTEKFRKSIIPYCLANFQ